MTPPVAPRQYSDGEHGTVRRRVVLFGAGIWLIITLLIGRARARARAEQTVPASTTSPDQELAPLEGPSVTTGTGQPRWLIDPRRCVTADCFLLTLAVLTVAVCLASTDSIARLLLVLSAACLIPGSALLTRLPVEDVFEALGLALGLGFCIEAAGALAMIWTGWWHPFGWAAVLVAASCVMFVLDLRRVAATARDAL